MSISTSNQSGQLIGQDASAQVIRDNLDCIQLVAIHAVLLQSDSSRERIHRFLSNRLSCGKSPLVLMLVCLNDEQRSVAVQLQSTYADKVRMVRIVQQSGYNKTVGNALKLYQEVFGQELKAFEIKRHCLFLIRRGGQGKPQFVDAFTGGAGTTCGEFTRPVMKKRDGTLIKGFIKANVTAGFCPVGCPFCYLQAYQMDAMQVALNLDDLAEELSKTWYGFAYPINFCEVSGLIEYDEWFADEYGTGSIAQSIIEACSEARVTPFLLTKIRFPKYLNFDSKVQTGISLMPEVIRVDMAPFGSPAEELLASLAETVKKGAIDPVVRLTVFYEKIEHYPELLKMCREYLGEEGWRMTLDIMRFTPSTAKTIAKRYPDLSQQFASEVAPDEPEADLGELATRAGKEKKLRPTIQRQAEIYRWFRTQLNNLGCHAMDITPCKGSPQELIPLVKEGTINAMPCACYGTESAQGIKWVDGLPRRSEIPS